MKTISQIFGTYIFFIITMSFSNAQTSIENEIFIWPSDAPGSQDLIITEVVDERSSTGDCHLNRAVSKVISPSLKLFEPANPNGKAVILCPGGGYALLAYDKEGYNIAQWFADRDITAFVLKYRLPIDGHQNAQDVPLQDVQRAFRYVRSNAAAFKIEPDQIGVMGGSAGGHVAASASVFYDREVYEPVDMMDSASARPDFSILMYPVISFQDDLTHAGSRTNLLGSDISQELKNEFSTELHVDENTPPAFLFHSLQDGSVKWQNSEAYANALEEQNIEASLNLYQSGGHGVGKCEAGDSDFARWPLDLNQWLVSQGLAGECTGESLNISISGDEGTVLTASDAASYQWYKDSVAIEGATQTEYLAEESGNYMVSTLATREGTGSPCEVYSESVIVDLCTAIKPEITAGNDGQVLRSSRSGQLQWYLDGEPIEGATERELTVSGNGDYTVEVISTKSISGDSCSIFSEAFIVEFILELQPEVVSGIYPNPAGSSLNVLGTFKTNSDYRIYKLNGAMVAKGSLELMNNEARIDIAHLDPGFYLLSIQTTDKTLIGKFYVR